MGKTKTKTKKVIIYGKDDQSLHRGFIFNKRVAALIVGALAFIVAFAVNSLVQAAFKEHVAELDKTEAWLMYTLAAVIIAIIIINLLYKYLV